MFETTGTRGSARQQFAEKLRAVREKSGCTLRELQAVTFVSDSSLSRYLSGQSMPPWSVVVAICDLAQVDPSSLRPAWQAARSERDARTVPAAGDGSDPALHHDITTVTKAVAAAIKSLRNGGGPILELLLAAERAAHAASHRLADQPASRALSAAADGGTKK